MVSRESAYIRVVSGFSRCLEFNDLFFIMVQEFACPNNILAGGNKSQVESFRSQIEGFHGHGVCFARLDQYDVVGHGVWIGKKESDFFTCLNGKGGGVVLHFFDQCANTHGGYCHSSGRLDDWACRIKIAAPGVACAKRRSNTWPERRASILRAFRDQV